MKPTWAIDAEMLDNRALFNDPFYQRFVLRKAAAPLALTNHVSKDYWFPTFYGDVTCAQGIFFCNYDKAQQIMPHPRIQPVSMGRGRALVAFSCYEYKTVLGIQPYNEIAMTIPVMADCLLNMPVLPMLAPIFKPFGYYVFSMPVTSYENQLRGLKIWGLPKVVQEIDIREEAGDCVTVACDERGEEYFALRVPTSGAATSFDVRSNLYSRLGKEMLQSETCFQATFQVTKYMPLLLKKGVAPKRPFLTIGQGAAADVLRHLAIEEHPFQLRFARGMRSCFDLPNPNYQSTFKFF